MAKDINDTQSVTDFIQKFEPDFAHLLESIRKVILDTDPIIGERIKWNSPSFFYMGEMQNFNAKEYKRDLTVFNVRKGVVLLIFPTGASIQDNFGLLEGNYTDGRRMITFKNIEKVKAKAKDLQEVIRQWLKNIS